MQILFTKNSSPLSWLIRFGLDEPCSHMAYELDGKLIFHSTLTGVGVNFSSNFHKKNKVVSMINVDLTLQEEDEVYYKSIASKEGKSWDFLGFFYFAYRVFLLKFFGKELPEKNKFNQQDAYLCVELINCLPDRIKSRLQISDISMTTPYGVFKAFNKTRVKKLESH